MSFFAELFADVDGNTGPTRSSRISAFHSIPMLVGSLEARNDR